MLIAREGGGAATALNWGGQVAGISTEVFLQEEGLEVGPKGLVRFD